MGESENPDEGLFYLRNEINKLFQDVLSEEDFFDGAHFPVMDIIENDDSFRIEIEIPGLNKDAIKMEILGNQLILAGNKTDTENKDRINYICMERRFGYFKRSVTLPNIGDMSELTTSHKNGILTITVSKHKERRNKSRTIEIE